MCKRLPAKSALSFLPLWLIQLFPAGSSPPSKKAKIRLPLKLSFSLAICPGVDCWITQLLYLSSVTNVHTVVHSGCTCLHSHQERSKVLFSSSHPPQPLWCYSHFNIRQRKTMSCIPHNQIHTIQKQVYSVTRSNYMSLPPGHFINQHKRLGF